MHHKLYLISTPIGNYDDITIRGLNLLKEADLIVCEEYKAAARMLNHFEIKKELLSLNEHNERENAAEVVKAIKSDKKVCLISDGGAPLFSDPGHYLVDLCISAKIKIVPVPGGNSLIPALTGSGLDIEQFYYYGWLSPKKEIRRKELAKLKTVKELIVLLETPYRLKRLLADVVSAFGRETRVVLAYRLTMPEEEFLRGPASFVLKEAEKRNLKGEFVLLIENR